MTIEELYQKMQDLFREERKHADKKFVTKDDLKGFATKEDLKKFATKDDLKGFATKEDLKKFATKDDLKRFATKDDLIKFKDEILREIEKLREDSVMDTGLRDQIEDHEIRIEVLEKSSAKSA